MINDSDDSRHYPVQEYLDICSSLPSHRHPWLRSHHRPTQRLSPVQNSLSDKQIVSK